MSQHTLGLPPRQASVRQSFSLKLRKRKTSDISLQGSLDAVSLMSLDLNMSKKSKKKGKMDFDNISISSTSSLTIAALKNVRRKSLGVVSNITSMVKESPSIKKVGSALQRTLSTRSTGTSPSVVHKFREPQPHQHKSGSVSTSSASKRYLKNTAAVGQSTVNRKPRGNVLWSESCAADGNITSRLSSKDIKRQEAIFELRQGESDLVEDLSMVNQVYKEGLQTLKLMSDEEIECIFGKLNQLQQIHGRLSDLLNDSCCKENLYVHSVGDAIIEWIPYMKDTYIDYCSNQMYAKDVLDIKRQDKKIEDFLQRCIQSPFSRKLDIWSFLDVPRSRLVKYPLLFKSILKQTDADHVDHKKLVQAIQDIESVIHDVDVRTGVSECQFYVSRMIWADALLEEQADNSQFTSLLCSGILKNTKGSKLKAFLFNNMFVLTKTLKKNNIQFYHVHRKPIIAAELAAEVVGDSDAKKSSFLHSSSHNTGKYLLKVWSKADPQQTSYTLQCGDAHDRKQWLQCISAAALSAAASTSPVRRREMGSRVSITRTETDHVLRSLCDHVEAGGGTLVDDVDSCVRGLVSGVSSPPAPPTAPTTPAQRGATGSRRRRKFKSAEHLPAAVDAAPHTAGTCHRLARRRAVAGRAYDKSQSMTCLPQGGVGAAVDNMRVTRSRANQLAATASAAALGKAHSERSLRSGSIAGVYRGAARNRWASLGYIGGLLVANQGVESSLVSRRSGGNTRKRSRNINGSVESVGSKRARK